MSQSFIKKPNQGPHSALTGLGVLRSERPTEKQLQILRHSLGLTRGKEAYRNHFVTGEGSDDHPECMALVQAGLMTRRPGNVLSGGDDIFTVTDAGKAVAQGSIDPERAKENERG